MRAGDKSENGGERVIIDRSSVKRPPCRTARLMSAFAPQLLVKIYSPHSMYAQITGSSCRLADDTTLLSFAGGSQPIRVTRVIRVIRVIRMIRGDYGY